MKSEFDLFERFPNGSSLWRGTYSEFEATCLQMQVLARGSENQFYAISLTTGEVLTPNSIPDSRGSLAPRKTERRSKGQAA
jgi:hypothetical protein